MSRLLKKLLVFSVAIAALVGCERQIQREFRAAQSEAQNQNWRTALTRYQDLLKLDPSDELSLKAAREGARIAMTEVKDYSRALAFYHHLIYYTKNPAEAAEAQRQIIDIHFEHLQNYPKAIEEISRLLQVESDPEKRIEYRVKLARSYYHMNDFTQASAEVEGVLRNPDSRNFEFDLKLLKANILMASKQYDQAVGLLEELLAKWRKKAIQENVAMTLAVCFEEKKDFKAAIQLLENVKNEHPVPEYVDLRVKRLRERSLNQPGARGFRK